MPASQPDKLCWQWIKSAVTKDLPRASFAIRPNRKSLEKRPTKYDKRLRRLCCCGNNRQCSRRRYVRLTCYNRLATITLQRSAIFELPTLTRTSRTRPLSFTHSLWFIFGCRTAGEGIPLKDKTKLLAEANCRRWRLPRTIGMCYRARYLLSLLPPYSQPFFRWSVQQPVVRTCRRHLERQRDRITLLLMALNYLP